MYFYFLVSYPYEDEIPETQLDKVPGSTNNGDVYSTPAGGSWLSFNIHIFVSITIQQQKLDFYMLYLSKYTKKLVVLQFILVPDLYLSLPSIWLESGSLPNL